eukprot:CAMPEP_0197664448 /NCGR_PEP_ID=MMETSP1338-20131121/58638_1 /TAXON_ID=43686 ORGANISM="Pelagodinium beii, Strain RCC1491" /NCGR_SAMPLE_ID=MMETSP1338 /ASSEMBLY_ACC=CAM_ASM_000754 /LENGTH=451 /DNA_ID=CAMNT_0043243081 /DNA_START=6 /DNA_END=1361 /DNA_ORIENTATION=+
MTLGVVPEANPEAEPLRQVLRDVLGSEAASQEDLLQELSSCELHGMLKELGLQSKAAAAKEIVPGEFSNVCAWCGATRSLPFDLRSSFVCEDAGFTCRKKILIEDDAPEEQDEMELFEHVCACCRAVRYLPFQLGYGFICGDVELECQDAAGQDTHINCCAFCGSQRELPFDFGEEFVCDFAGFDCDYSSEEAQQRAAQTMAEVAAALDGQSFVNICGQCGLERELPFDLSGSFVCGDAGLECRHQEMYSNVCEQCGQTRMCPFQLDDGFLCGDCDTSTDRRRYEEISRPDAPSEEELDDGLTDEARQAMRREHERTQLLWKVLIQGLSATDRAELFGAAGFEPPSEEELQDLRTNTLAHLRKKTVGSRMMAKSALKNKKKGGTQKRWLNDELVTVAKKDKYVRTGGESLEDKAKTSVELYILGIGRGGRHCVKIAREEKKKGPVSNKHHR